MIANDVSLVGQKITYVQSQGLNSQQNELQGGNGKTYLLVDNSQNSQSTPVIVPSKQAIVVSKQSPQISYNQQIQSQIPC